MSIKCVSGGNATETASQNILKYPMNPKNKFEDPVSLLKKNEKCANDTIIHFYRGNKAEVKIQVLIKKQSTELKCVVV